LPALSPSSNNKAMLSSQGILNVVSLPNTEFANENDKSVHNRGIVHGAGETLHTD
jgi:hypothetical protein